MPSTRLPYLFQRYFEKTATDAERAELMSLLQDPSADAEIKALMEHTWDHFQDAGISEEAAHFSPLQSEELLRNILGNAGNAGAPGRTEISDYPTAAGQTPVLPIQRINWGRAVAASVLFLVIGGAAWRWTRSNSFHAIPREGQKSHAWAQDKEPGGNNAILILGDGSRISLDSAHNGTLARQGNAQILKLTGGRLAYQVSEGGGSPSGKGGVLNGGFGIPPATFNTIVTPRGGQYQVVLPDGTKAWLNAASSLRFPTAFTGKDREVELTGEGYFEVARDKQHPFRVKAGEVRVDVLGTRFDVMAYSDEGSINTCLLDGSVKVSRGDQSGWPRPGEQARFFPGTGRGGTGPQPATPGRLQMATVDTEQVVAWKNGLFQFDDITIEPLMRQVARWYDVQVVYKGNIHTHFSGLISRNATLDQMLAILRKEGSATYRLEENTITVTPH